MKKPKVIFVGSFLEKAKDGSVGGQMFACRSLINSTLSNDVKFILIDSTAVSVPAPPLYKRLTTACKRVFVFFFSLFKKDVKTVLIFTSAGFSFIEKGFMITLASLFGKKTILAPRSGLTKDDYANSKFFRWYIPYIIKKSDQIICQGKSWQNYYMEISNQNENKFIIIQNWIDVSPYTKNRINASEPTSNDIIQILYLGWLEEYKGVFDLISAINIVKNTNIKFKLKIYGMGSKKDEMLEMIEKLDLSNYIEYGGWITGDDKILELQKANIFVLPSHREGMPNALIEAMACGLPVVATKVGGIPELIENNYSGILVEDNSPGQLADALLSLLKSKNKRLELGHNAYQSVLKNNSIDVAATTLKNILVK